MKQVISILLLWIGVLSCQSEDINIYTLHAKDESKAIDGWKLIWSEEFNQEGPQFDADKWIFEPKGNSPWNKYLTGSTEQAYVQNGRLILRAEKKGGQYMTGGISTRGKAGFKYGKLEICAKFNSFQGGWPAIWLLPVQRQYPNPPGANEYGGEIDIMEQVSLEKVAWHTVHSHYTLDLGLDKNPPRAGGGAYKENEFNLYTLEWTPEELTFLINGEETFKFESSVVGGAIPKEYIPAVGEGIEEAAQAGILGGFPVLGVHANVYDGSYHEVDSSEMAFHIAGSMAFKEAMQKASPVLLEPIMKVEVTMPEEYMGDVIGDINSRRGRIEGMDDIGGGKLVKAYVPLAEMFGYSTDLRSKTQGRGNYSMFFEKYEPVPKNVQEKVLADKSK